MRDFKRMQNDPPRALALGGRTPRVAVRAAAVPPWK